MSQGREAPLGWEQRTAGMPAGGVALVRPCAKVERGFGAKRHQAESEASRERAQDPSGTNLPGAFASWVQLCRLGADGRLGAGAQLGASVKLARFLHLCRHMQVFSGGSGTISTVYGGKVDYNLALWMNEC